MSGNDKAKAYALRVWALKDEQKQLGEDIRAVFDEAEDNGVDPKALREAMRRARMDRAVRDAADQYELEL